jgi:XTP/dITP diphosphohydrolase
MRKLLIATNNPGKLVEFQALLAGLDLELVTPARLGLHLEVEENGQTYAENAAAKALAFAEASKLVSLADDSGLEVEALGGEPGIRSHRFAPQPGASDSDRRAYLLARLAGHPRPWRGRFFCTVAVAVPEAGQGKSIVRFAEGACPGEIIPEERGENGFGYDPIFLIPELNRTMAELNMEEKNRLSHRARAVMAARPALAGLLGLPS